MDNRTDSKAYHKPTLTAGLPVCPLPQTTCAYRVHCDTASTLPLAMSTQSVDRAADGTEIIFLSCLTAVSGLIDLITAVICGPGNEG